MQHCTRCGGQTIPNYDEVKCLQCGHSLDQRPDTNILPPKESARKGKYGR